ncbi:MAG: hypothetical protein A2808_02195 [Candidatus Moranbacteria bacterium RIFCSPHIGHO2_01_FULL_55_24]|nr:MAG: hypothetical protein A2808_02195 [Candidatus Moranbacteria bacterium RIFCSPHIGHO2_01_FULL_55_24]
MNSTALIKSAWETLKKHIFFVWIVLGITWGISLFFSLLEKNFQHSALEPFFGILSFFAMFFLQLGSIHMFLHLVRTGEELSLEHLFSQREIFWRAILSNILYYLMVIIGLIFLIVPGIYLGLRYYFLSYVFVDKKTSIGEAFSQSSKLTEGKKWDLFGFFLLLIALNILGALLFLVGLVVTIPLTTLAIVYAYVSLAGGPKEEEKVEEAEPAPKEEVLPEEPGIGLESPVKI